MLKIKYFKTLVTPGALKELQGLLEPGYKD
jgi:hypothetical protein